MHPAVVALALTLPLAAEPKDVAAVVARHLDACGGAARLRAVSSSREIGTVLVTDGARTSKGPSLSEEKRPNRFRAERTVHGVSSVQGFDGTTVWSQRHGEKPEILTGEVARGAARNEFDHFLLDYGPRGIKVELLGVAAIESGPAYQLKVTLPHGEVRLSYLDKRTFLEMRRDYIEGPASSQQWFRGHQTFSGVVRPTIFEMFYPATGRRVVLSLDRVEIDPKIDDERFKLPQ
jgi:hypothetical protein